MKKKMTNKLLSKALAALVYVMFDFYFIDFNLLVKNFGHSVPFWMMMSGLIDFFEVIILIYIYEIIKNFGKKDEDDEDEEDEE